MELSEVKSFGISPSRTLVYIQSGGESTASAVAISSRLIAASQVEERLLSEVSLEGIRPKDEVWGVAKSSSPANSEEHIFG